MRIGTLIQESLSRLIKDKTVLVIAHRMRTVAGADKIVVLADGTVAQQGSPKKLEKGRRHLQPHGKRAARFRRMEDVKPFHIKNRNRPYGSDFLFALT